MRLSLIVSFLLLETAVAFSPSYRGARTTSILKAEEEDPQQQAPTTSKAIDLPTKEKKPKEHEDETFTESLLGALGAASGAAAAELFSVFRRTAASALTTSLPSEERKELLSRLETKDDSSSGSDDSSAMTTQANSVNENIAAAAAAESLKNEKWELEKQKILEQAEQAANERIANELSIQKSRMEAEKRQLKEEAEAAMKKVSKEEPPSTFSEMEKVLQEKEKQILSDRQEIEKLNQELKSMKKEKVPMKSTEKMKPSRVIASPSQKMPLELRRYTANEYRALSEKDKAELKKLREKHPELAVDTKEEAEERKEEAEESKEGPGAPKGESGVHPILGPIIEDLGYKRIHLVSAGKLGSLPIWRKQRIYRHDRVRAMAADKWKAMDLGLPGVICLHEDDQGKLSIIDGQHRVGMMMLIRDRQRKKLEDAEKTAKSPESDKYIDFDRVLVEVYPNKHDLPNQAQDLFLEINKAEPVQLIDIPGVAKSKDRAIITEAVGTLNDKYPKMFSPSQRCRVPNVNADNLRDRLFGSGVLKRHNLTTSKKLVDWMLAQNELLASNYENNEDERSFFSPKAWKKASQNQFYLGLETSWLFN